MKKNFTKLKKKIDSTHKHICLGISASGHTKRWDINYYIELEQVKLTNGEQAITNFVAALQHGE